MKKTQDTIRQDIPLSAEVQAFYGIDLDNEHPKVPVQSLPNGFYGWVENTPDNYLAGTVVHLRGIKSFEGPQDYSQFTPIDNEVPQLEVVGRSIATEIARLSGTFDEQGLWTPGDRDRLGELGRGWRNWVTQTPAEVASMNEAIQEFAKDRQGATNDARMIAGDIASRMLLLANNPGALLAMSPTLDREFQIRRDQLEKTFRTNNSRTAWISRWLYHENSQLDQVHGVLKDYKDGELDPDLFRLRLIAPHIRFRHHAFNYLAHSIGQTGGKLEERSQLDNFEQGLYFDRYKSYLLMPFRMLVTKRNRIDLPGAPAEYVEEKKDEVNQRLELLQKLPLPGPYELLGDRILEHGAQVVDSLERRKQQDMKSVAKVVGHLINFHCLPQDENEREVWYGSQLRANT